MDISYITSLLSAMIVFLQSVDLTKILLLQFPHAGLFIVGSNALNSAVAVYSSQLQSQSQKKLYWLHSLALVVLSGFGGGIIAFVMIGKPSIVMANDSVLAMCLLCWYLMHHVPVFRPVALCTPMRLLCVAGVALFRTHAIFNIVTTANQCLAAGPYYPIPLVGPILAGTC